MKGISPMIATVLLIAFTIAIGGILSVWLSGYTKTATTTVETTTEAEIKCASSILFVKEAKYSTTSNWITAIVSYEGGSEDLYNFTITVAKGGYFNTTTISTYTKTSPLKAGQIFAQNMTSSDMSNIANLIPPDLVRVRAVCQDTVSKIGECKSGQACMKAG